MGQTIACTNQKGGVGKTTTVVNLATYLALLGDRVLVIDFDPQGNATSGFGIDKSTVSRSIYDAVIGDAPLAELHVETPVPGVRLVPSSIELAGPEHDKWDWILIDCPPSLGLLTVNALTGADAVLVPVQCEYYALEGLTSLLATINLVRDHLNPGLTIAGVVLTMFDSRTNLAGEVATEVRRHLREVVFETIVPRSVRLSEAPSHGLPIALYRPESRGAVAYHAVARELRARRAASLAIAAAAAAGSVVPARPGLAGSGL